jgi:glycosyl transferase family 25
MPTEANIWPWVARHRVSDRWYQRQLGRRFPIVCVSPGLVHQTAGFSDIVQRNADYLREHQLEVTSPARGALLFTFEYWLRRMRVQLGLAGDVLRGWTRRINGF